MDTFQDDIERLLENEKGENVSPKKPRVNEDAIVPMNDNEVKATNKRGLSFDNVLRELDDSVPTKDLQMPIMKLENERNESSKASTVQVVKNEMMNNDVNIAVTKNEVTKNDVNFAVVQNNVCVNNMEDKRSDSNAFSSLNLQLTSMLEVQNNMINEMTMQRNQQNALNSSILQGFGALIKSLNKEIVIKPDDQSLNSQDFVESSVTRDEPKATPGALPKEKITKHTEKNLTDTVTGLIVDIDKKNDKRSDTRELPKAMETMMDRLAKKAGVSMRKFIKSKRRMDILKKRNEEFEMDPDKNSFLRAYMCRSLIRTLAN